MVALFQGKPLPGSVVALGLLVAAAVMGGHHAPSGCSGLSTPSAPPGAEASAARVAVLLEGGPCATGGRVAWAVKDDHGSSMDVLDPIADPSGGYLGVYHIVTGARQATSAPAYQLLLAHSGDLVHWHRLAVLDGAGASMGALQAVPGGPGFLLAYEKAPAQTGHYVRVCYYASRAELVAARSVGCANVPRRFSALNDGTPSFLSIQWRGALNRSLISLAFHYQAEAGGRPGPDREAAGTLSGFRRWRARRNSQVDAALNRAGLPGSHGDERQFSYGGQPWRVYEANTSGDAYATWYAALYDPGSSSVYPLAFETPFGVFSRSFGNPIVEILPRPGGRGTVMAMTMFLFSSGPAAQSAGEMVFYRPL